ncbi:hypothetical protein SNK03_002524 [Fusarium graminearum]|nr:unnamed protein product [Fusarium graminearum]
MVISALILQKYLKQRMTPGESLTVVTISEPSTGAKLKTMCRFHVLGSLSKDDGASHAYVAKIFYQSLKQDESDQTTDWMVAKALHDAIESDRDLAKDPRWWAPYIHSGP